MALETFRTSKYVQRNELIRFQLDDVIQIPANGQHQEKNGYKFTINDRSSIYDWYNAYFEVQFTLQKLAGTAYIHNANDRITVINGTHSLIYHMMIKSAGKIVYDTNNLHKVTFVKNLLEYSDDYSRSVAKNSFWYLDTDNTTADTNKGFEARRLLTKEQVANGGAPDINVIIPLNRYGFFEELEDRILVPMQLQFNIQLQNDDELIYMGDAPPDDGRVVINRFLLWVPKLTPRDSLYDEFVNNYLKPSTWNYSREMYQVSGASRSSGFFQISSSIDNVKSVFVYLQRAKTDNASENPYIFDTYKLNAADANSSLTTCRLEYGNGIFYPETEYDSESKVRIFNDLMSYSDKRTDYNSGTQLNLSNYNDLFPIIYFDLSYQADKVTRDPKQLIFRYKLNANSTADFRVHAIVLYNEAVVINKIGNEVVIA